jgi:acyl-CoA synthetase (AMP-forming)/AMP-acid ligase II
MIANSSFLSLLQSHADLRGDSLVHLLPDRDITYRRLWSRIERASARLQGEWNVQQGDVVAYCGNAHPDAIVLYFALLRIGASLLSLEDSRGKAIHHWLQLAGARLIVHDDGYVVEQAFAQPLSMLLADWCHFDPLLVKEDPSLPALLLPQPDGESLQPYSLQQLLSLMAPVPAALAVGQIIFEQRTLTSLILPSLRDAKAIRFSVVEKMLDALPKASSGGAR